MTRLHLINVTFSAVKGQAMPGGIRVFLCKSYIVAITRENVDNYWHCAEDQLFRALSCGREGLTGEEAAKRLKDKGPNTLKSGVRTGNFRLFFRQFKSPLTLILLAASILSVYLGQRSDALIVMVILLAGAFLGFYQEKGAAQALRQLLKLVQVQVPVRRDGKDISLPLEEIVPGDVVYLNAGQTVPGDCRLLTSKDLYVNEASLTGETFPAEKNCVPVAQEADLHEKHNILFMGTHVISGTATALVVHTGAGTEFGAISGRLRRLQPETEFEKGIRRFGFLLMEVTLLLVLIIFTLNIALHKPVLDSFLFSMAIAVGLTPQLLPAIISINLSKGAASMAKNSVIVRRLSAIENFGGMDILCTDKTGTITTGEIVLHKAIAPDDTEAPSVFRMAYINAQFETGFSNPIDQAILKYGTPDIADVVKLDELPYDFIRRRLSILVTDGGERILITKGAFDEVLGICNYVILAGGRLTPLEESRESLVALYARYSEEGFRVLAVACKRPGPPGGQLKKEDETDMVFAGLLLLADPLKEGIPGTLAALRDLGISVRIITGDNALVARHISRQAGLQDPTILTGAEIRKMSTEALIQQASKTQIFASVEPNQKEIILFALKKAGHVVGFLGDGINDAPALHSADVGISVNGAADVAREAADIVLLGNDLSVLIQGVKEGRKTFANTLKYIFMATSANFGNMFSMAGASLFLPFLPLLPKQVLLTNLLTDIPEMTIATDAVDDSMLKSPRRIDIRFIRRFMIVFGIISSVFDYLTFGVLLYWLKAGTAEFRTGWFVESVISASFIVLAVRTSGAFYRSRPGKWLLVSTLAVAVITLLLPYTPLATPLGFVPLPAGFYASLAAILLCYLSVAELAKRLFYRQRTTKHPISSFLS